MEEEVYLGDHTYLSWQGDDVILEYYGGEGLDIIHLDPSMMALLLDEYKKKGKQNESE